MIEKVLEHLNMLNIDFTIDHHPPIYTIGELEAYKIKNKDKIAKNLFLRNDSGKQHYLVVLRQDKEVDLKALRAQIGSSRLGFASEERLIKRVGLSKGSVTPLGVLNDQEAHVIVCMDKDLLDEPIVGVHPNTNEATVWLTPNDVVRVVKENGNVLKIIEI